MKNVKLVVFDMAGTTVDEDNVVYKTLQKAINQYDESVTLDFVLDHGAGKEKHQAIKDIVIHLAEGQRWLNMSEVIFSEFVKMLDLAYGDLVVKPCAGVVDFIGELRKLGIKVALNTGYNSEVANLLLKKLSWEKGREYDILVTADLATQSRPHPDMIYLAMDGLGLKDSSDVVKIGDSIIDIEEGKNAGCGMTVGVTTGAQTRIQLLTANPTCVVDNVLELLDILK
ncbi:HAD-IA family hydrolase [Membranihabitans marinus]|uniref:HAD-IA family hydrolase n=1 Tax=Membranihabitans marinus TaxID=1227546 RepID=UPI001F032D53|nr:HAD-IA family hydrolase [Membranihabitans marinus]